MCVYVISFIYVVINKLLLQHPYWCASPRVQALDLDPQLNLTVSHCCAFQRHHSSRGRLSRLVHLPRQLLKSTEEEVVWLERRPKICCLVLLGFFILEAGACLVTTVMLVFVKVCLCCWPPHRGMAMQFRIPKRLSWGCDNWWKRVWEGIHGVDSVFIGQRR